ncbi:hypothetical protein LEMLEM_LOCUS7922 [Lemmus lemmus]
MVFSYLVPERCMPGWICIHTVHAETHGGQKKRQNTWNWR